MSASDVLSRHAEALVMEALADTRVVVINGARQVGKSTLARLAVDALPDAAARFLDDAAERDAARDDPAGFVRHPGLLLLDEVQRVPDLLLAVKYEVDQDPRPGRFPADRFGSPARAAGDPGRLDGPRRDHRAVAACPG